MSNSLQPHGLKHARPPCPSLSPRDKSSLKMCVTRMHVYPPKEPWARLSYPTDAWLSWWGRWVMGSGEARLPCFLRGASFPGQTQTLCCLPTGWRGGGQEGGGGSWTEGRRELCVHSGERKRGGANPGGRPSQEKAAIVKAGQLHPGPQAPSQEEAKSFLLCAAEAEIAGAGVGGETRERRTEHRKQGGGSEGGRPGLDGI